MGFLDKMKNLFTEEIEEEEIKPQKKEVKSVEIPPFRRENVVTKETNNIPLTESKLEENKEKFVFPVYFDDKDFDDLEKPKAKPIAPKGPKKEEIKREPYQGAKVTIEPEPKKVFKPSPIISPVYGVLDKNYSKDDITTKKDKSRPISASKKPENMTIDDIRKKAYGTLEDDLEDTLSYDFSEIIEKPKHEASNREALDIFNELNFDEIEETRENKFNEIEKNIILDRQEKFVDDDDTEELARQLEEQKKKLEEISQYMTENEITSDHEEETIESEEFEEIDSTEEVEEIEVSEKSETDGEKNLNDSELFDLIDSMYEKKEDDE